MSPETKNLISGLLEEISRNREILNQYEGIPQGKFAEAIIKSEIKEAERALKMGDVTEMLIALQKLKGTK